MLICNALSLHNNMMGENNNEYSSSVFIAKTFMLHILNMFL